jgi:hypothetical protein
VIKSVDAREPAGTLVGELARTVAIVVLVVGTTALLLRALDAVPRYLLGEPRGIRAYATVEEAERRVKARLFLPAYFPDTIRWPPAAVRVDSGPPRAVGLTFVARQGGDDLLFILQSFGDTRRHSSRLLPAAVALQTTTVAIREATGEVTRVATEDGRVWHDITWPVGGRSITLRFRGALDEALRMARSTGP